MTVDGKILISGAGIAGLTLAILLKEQGRDLLVVERDKGLRTAGYMMDFFGSGWDVAERMGLVPALRAIRYPIERFNFVDARGHVYASMPLTRVDRALGGKYVYLRRSDLERILYDRAMATGVKIVFGREITAIDNTKERVHVTFNDGSQGDYALVFGADGVHSGVRRLVFSDEGQFACFLGGYVAAFHLGDHNFDIGHALSLYEEQDRLAAYYPLDETRFDATYVFRHDEMRVAPQDRLAFVRKAYAGAGWIAEDMLKAYRDKEPIYFDSLTQIVMPEWCKGRVALLGDACGCLTLLAGQGSHMAMAGAYVIARELARHDGDYAAAFAAYAAKLKPAVTERQKDAASFARYFIPSERSRLWLRRLTIKIVFSPLVLPRMFRWFGAKSVLEGYD
ncbi:MAG TPA: FAD-dependent monooxygenase [Methyloceanibacter sp.]|nr:FAD-dependent monooxygenase [Methyloceanibacter sp.]